MTGVTNNQPTEMMPSNIDNLPIYGKQKKPDGPNSWASNGNLVFTSRGVCPVVSAFSDGQGEKGVEIAGLEIYNGGLAKMCDNQGWSCFDVELPLTGNEEIPKTEEDELAVHGVKNCRSAGTKLGLINERMKATVAENNGLLVNLGGDHSCAGASVSALLDKYPNLRVIWVDAHADCNTPTTSPSGNYHGMVLGHLMGWFEKPLPGFEWMNTDTLKEAHVAYIGLRDIDDGERALLKKSNLTYFTMQSLEELPFGTAIDHVMKTIDPQGTAPYHISFDVDGADPAVAPGTGTLCEGGLNYSQSLRIVEKVAATGRLVGLDVMEVNVDLDTKEAPLHGDDPAIDSQYRTVKFALHLIRAAMGYVAL